MTRILKAIERLKEIEETGLFRKTQAYGIILEVIKLLEDDWKEQYDGFPLTRKQDIPTTCVAEFKVLALIEGPSYIKCCDLLEECSEEKTLEPKKEGYKIDFVEIDPVSIWEPPAAPKSSPRHTRPKSPIPWKELREEILRRDGYKCNVCGGVDCLEVHHVVPCMNCGMNNPSNLITLCRSCHKRAHNHPESQSKRIYDKCACSH